MLKKLSIIESVRRVFDFIWCQLQSTIQLIIVKQIIACVMTTPINVIKELHTSMAHMPALLKVCYLLYLYSTGTSSPIFKFIIRTIKFELDDHPV